MNISMDVLSDELRDKIIEELSASLGVDSGEISLKSLDYELAYDTLNLKEIVRKTIIKAMARSSGKIATAAKQLGVTRKTLYAMIKKYELGSVLHIRD